VVGKHIPKMHLLSYFEMKKKMYVNPFVDYARWAMTRSMWVSDCLSFFLVPSWSSSTPLYPKVLRAKEHAPTPYLSTIFTSDSHLSLSRSLECVNRWKYLWARCPFKSPPLSLFDMLLAMGWGLGTWCPFVVRPLGGFFGRGSFHFVPCIIYFLGALIYLWLVGFHHYDPCVFCDISVNNIEW
jgi:hypothetical protein